MTMRWIRTLLWALVAMSATALVGSLPAEHHYEARATLVQRIQQDEAASLFGEAGTPIGSPQRLIIDDHGAFMAGEENGVRLVSQNYLDQHKIYPLQLQTIQFFMRYIRIGAGTVLVLSLAALGALRAKS